MNLINILKDNTVLIPAGLFVLSFVVQMLYYFVFYMRTARYRSGEKTGNKLSPVSVIICARDEAENLQQNLPAILSQDYPDYEVIVVNDCSQDDTEEVLIRLKAKYKNLRTTIIKEDQKFRHGKKLAATIGIKAAKNEWLLFTDADCYPVSDKWIKSMAAEFTDEKSIVLGYGGYEHKKGILNNLIRFDTFFIALQYTGFAIAGKPYMGVGRNLAYRRSLFFDNKGFARHSNLQSGDDDLFVNEVATKGNTAIVLNQESFTRSIPKTSFSAWLAQKRRHLTTGKYYRGNHKFLLGAENISRILFYLFFILLIVDQTYLYLALAGFVIRLATQLSVFKITMKRLNEKDLFLSSLIYDILLPIINAFLLILNRFSRKKQHKWR
ncbi:MAG TPA: glycosyltransferase [Bacteroidales bacterium]|nr:glycosyltransferase [Bacteroidales bacterium]